MTITSDNYNLDEAGNLSIAGNLSTDKGIWAGKHIVMSPFTVADLPPIRITVDDVDSPNPDSYGFFLVIDALDAVKGQPALGGSPVVLPTLVWNDGTVYRVL